MENATTIITTGNDHAKRAPATSYGTATDIASNNSVETADVQETNAVSTRHG